VDVVEIGAVVVMVVAAFAVPAQAGPSRQATKSSTEGAASSSSSSEYVVLYASDASAGAAHAAIEAAGGAVLKENTTVGLATVRATNANFLSAVTSQDAVSAPCRTARWARLHRPLAVQLHQQPRGHT